MGKYVFFTVCGLIASCFPSYAQFITLKGIVFDEHKEPVPYATVVISTDSISRKDISYAVTGNDGQFMIGLIAPQPDTRWISVRSIGYSTYHRRISLKSVKSPLHITLSEDRGELEEVVVVSKARDVYAKGDTLVFNSQNYTLGNERNIGDVIKRFPGMEVDQTGNISYQGKKVGKVLIDGQDILSSTGAAMNTLPPDFANSIELLANYQDGDIAQAFNADERLALNLKPARKAALNGSLEGGGGLKDKFATKTSLISVLPKLSASVIINANNTGEPVFSIQDYVMNVVDLESIRSGSSNQTSLSLSQEEQQLLLPSTNEYARTSGLVNLNLSWSPHKSYRLKANTIFNRGESKGTNTRTDIYTLPETSFTNHSVGSIQKETQLISQYISQRWIPSPLFSISAKTKIDIRKYDGDAITANTYGNNLLNAQDKPQSNLTGVRQDIEAKWLVGKGLIYGGGYFDSSNADADMETFADAPLLPLPYNTDGNALYTYSYNSEKKGVERIFNAYAGAMYPIWKDIYIKGEFAFSTKYEKQDITYSDGSRSKETSDFHVFKPYVGLLKNKGFFRFNIGTYFSSYKHTPHIGTMQANSLFQVEPHTTLEMVLSEKHRLMLSASRLVSPIAISYLSRQKWANAYDRIQLESGMSNAFAKSLKANFSYYYFSIYHRLSLYANMAYIRNRDTYLSATTSEGLLVSSSYQNGGWNNSLRSGLNMSKGIGSLPLDVKLSGTYTYNKNYLIRVEIPDQFISKEINAKLDFVSRMRKSPVNFELGARLNRLDMEFIYSAVHSWSRELGGVATIHIKQGDFSFSASGKSNRIKDAESKRYFNDMDFLAKYQFRKFDINLIAENMFHLGRNEWLKETLSPTVQSTVLYRRLPGHLLLSLSCTL